MSDQKEELRNWGNEELKNKEKLPNSSLPQFLNSFKILGLPETYPLDPATLEQAYFTAQRRFHPDRFIGKSEREKEEALAISSEINSAYETLKSPLKRAQAFLALHQITIGTDHDTVKPTALLMEAMELREEGADAAKLAALITESIEKITRHATNAAYTEMAHETLRLSYLMKARP